jgi:hypothetical protein
MYGKYEYLKVKKETTAGTAVTPDVPLEFMEADLDPNIENNFLSVAVAHRGKNQRLVAGKNGPVTGSIKLPVQAKTFGHPLQWTFGAPSTSGPTDSAYTHVFTPNAAGTIPTYTADFALMGLGYVHRVFGMRGASLKTSYSDNALMADCGISALGAFTVARVTTTAGSGTTLVISSTQGLTTSDTITVSYGDGTNSEDLTISNINADGVTLTVSSISKTHTAGDRVVIKSSTASYTVGSQFSGIGGSQFYIGSAIGSVAAFDAEDYTMDFSQEIDARHALTGVKESDRWPYTALVNGYEFKTSFKFYHSDPKWIDYMRGRSQLATKLEATGDLIGATATDLLRIELFDLRVDSYLPKYGQDGTVEEDISATVKYDSSAGFFGRITLINTTATY